MNQMHLLLFPLGAGSMISPCFAAEKKKPVVTTTKTVQIGGAPKRTGTSSITGGFSSLDKNSDGYLTRMEYSFNRQSTQAATEFDKLDANKDGRVSRSEYK